MSSDLVEELCPVSEVCPVSWRQNTLSSVRGSNAHSEKWLVTLCRWTCVRIPEKAWMFVNVKCFRHRGTLNSRRAASPIVKLVEGKKRWGAVHLQCSLKIVVEPPKNEMSPA
ncbi:hypothetical protein TNCV_2111841 [Trichonephila clavipes]|nr:hypothetical protein TNCV_2111841 [Trichonephila clavipes]